MSARDLVRKAVARPANTAIMILLCENNDRLSEPDQAGSAPGLREGFYYKPAHRLRAAEAAHRGADLPVRLPERAICPSCCCEGRLRGREGVRAADAGRFSARSNYYRGDAWITASRRSSTVLPRLGALARETGIPLVATNDCHYLDRRGRGRPGGAHVHPDGQDPRRTTQPHAHGTPRSSMSRARRRCAPCFPTFPRPLKTAGEDRRSAARSTFEFGHHAPAPLPHAPTGETAAQMLRAPVRRGPEGAATRTQGRPEPRAASGWNMSWTSSPSMGYVDYFLIVWDFINYAKQPRHHGGAGPRQRRGQHRGLLAWASPCMDPLKYNLLFERFLNPERVSMPDLDIDFCYERRQEVIDYVAPQVRRGPRGADHHLRHHGGHAPSSGTWAGCMGMSYAADGPGGQGRALRAGHDPRPSALELSPQLRAAGSRATRRCAQLYRHGAHAGGHAPPRHHPRGRRAHHQPSR